METIGQRISKARRYLNLKQKELAQMTGITEASLSRYENGVREPKSAILSKLADALEVSPDYLLGFTDERNYETCDISKKSEKDIKNILEDAEKMLKQDGLMFCGKPASKEAIDGVLNAIHMGMLLAIDKEKNK